LNIRKFLCQIPRQKNTYAVFLEYSQRLPEKIEHLLYPNSNKHIRLFNSPYIQHHQNIGLLSETEKSVILNSYEFFINTDNEYIDEAIACGAKVMGVDSSGKLNKYTNKDKDIISYANFIGSIL
jgi:hypothetical protein